MEHHLLLKSVDDSIGLPSATQSCLFFWCYIYVVLTLRATKKNSNGLTDRNGAARALSWFTNGLGAKLKKSYCKVEQQQKKIDNRRSCKCPLFLDFRESRVHMNELSENRNTKTRIDFFFNDYIHASAWITNATYSSFQSYSTINQISIHDSFPVACRLLVASNSIRQDLLS